MILLSLSANVDGSCCESTCTTKTDFRATVSAQGHETFWAFLRLQFVYGILLYVRGIISIRKGISLFLEQFLSDIPPIEIDTRGF